MYFITLKTKNKKHKTQNPKFLLPQGGWGAFGRAPTGRAFGTASTKVPPC